MPDLSRTPLLVEAGAFRHLGRIERLERKPNPTPRESELLANSKAQKKWLDQRQNLRFKRSRSEDPDPKKLKKFGIDPKVPEGGHPSLMKKHFPSDYRSSSAWETP